MNVIKFFEILNIELDIVKIEQVDVLVISGDNN